MILLLGPILFRLPRGFAANPEAETRRQHAYTHKLCPFLFDTTFVGADCNPSRYSTEHGNASRLTAGPRLRIGCHAPAADPRGACPTPSGEGRQPGCSATKGLISPGGEGEGRGGAIPSHCLFAWSGPLTLGSGLLTGVGSGGLEVSDQILESG